MTTTDIDKRTNQTSSIAKIIGGSIWDYGIPTPLPKIDARITKINEPQMQTPDEREAERERSTREYIEAQRRADIRAYYAAIISHYPNMAPDKTRWDDARLKPHAEAIARVIRWVPDSDKGLLLSGPTGRGKSRALFALMERLANDGRRFSFSFAGDWFASLGRQVRYGRDEAAEWVDAWAAKPILILDDIGQEAVLARNEDWAQAHFFRLLDLRCAKGLPLIASTNLTADQMAATTGKGIRSDPLIRRLLDLCEVVRFV